MSRKSLIITNADSTFKIEYVTNLKTGAELFTVSDVIGLDFQEGHNYPIMDKGKVYSYSEIKKYCEDNGFNLSQQTLDATSTLSENAVELEITTTSLDGGTASVLQVETATVVGTIEGVQQIETATVVGTIAVDGAGNAAVVVTAAGVTGSPLTISVAVENDDTAAIVAGKIRAELEATEAITDVYTVSGEDEDVVLTEIGMAGNDATLNISIDNDTCSGLTATPTSVDTQEGEADGSGNAAITITSALVTGSPLTIDVPVVAADDAEAIALAIRTTLSSTEAITDAYTVSGETDEVILTAIEPAANDATLNIAIADGTCSGITTASTSVNTTAGVAPTPYSDDVEADGGNGAYVFTLEDGDLPEGLTLSSTGTISGSPTPDSTTETFTVKVSDLFTSITKELSITIS